MRAEKERERENRFWMIDLDIRALGRQGDGRDSLVAGPFVCLSVKRAIKPDQTNGEWNRGKK